MAGKGWTGTTYSPVGDVQATHQYDVTVEFQIAFDWGGWNSEGAYYEIWCDGQMQSGWTTFSVSSGGGSWVWTTIGTKTFRITMDQSGAAKNVNVGANINTGVNPSRIDTGTVFGCTLPAVTWQWTVNYNADQSGAAKNVNVGANINTGVNPSRIDTGTVFGCTLPAVTWQWTVNYNANGGSGAPYSQIKNYGSTLKLSSSKPTRTGYIFQGWATSSGGGVAYSPGASYTANSGVTLYAVWKKITYSVKYDANGGTGAPAAQTKSYGDTLKLSTTKPTRNLYNFLGWGTSAASTTVAYAPGANYTKNEAVTLYAIWELAWVAPRITDIVLERCDSSGVSSETGTYYKISLAWATDRANPTVKVECKESTIRITDIVLERCDSSGVSSETGTYYKISLAWATDRANPTVKVECKESTITTWTADYNAAKTGTNGTHSGTYGSGGLDVEKTYDIRITVTDSVGSTVITRQIDYNAAKTGTNGTHSGTYGSGGLDVEKTYDIRITVTDSVGSTVITRQIAPMSFTIDFKAGGKGVAFGKPASVDNVIDSSWNFRAPNFQYLIDGRARNPITMVDFKAGGKGVAFGKPASVDNVIDSSWNFRAPNFQYLIDGRARNPITMVAGNQNGDGIQMGTGGFFIAGSGESASNYATAVGWGGDIEKTAITADNDIRLATNCQTIGNRNEFIFNSNGSTDFAPSIKNKAAIADRTDLNNMKTPGTYACLDAIAVTLKNCPIGIGFTMIVEHTYGSTSYISQTIIETYTASIYQRRYTASTNAWSTWKRLLNDSDIIVGSTHTTDSWGQDWRWRYIKFIYQRRYTASTNAWSTWKRLLNDSDIIVGSTHTTDSWGQDWRWRYIKFPSIKHCILTGCGAVTTAMTKQDSDIIVGSTHTTDSWGQDWRWRYIKFPSIKHCILTGCGAVTTAMTKQHGYGYYSNGEQCVYPFPMKDWLIQTMSADWQGGLISVRTLGETSTGTGFYCWNTLDQGALGHYIIIYVIGEYA